MSETIMRTAKDAAHPFTRVSNAVITNARLSLAARGLLAYLLSRPDDWQVRVADLQRVAGVGRDALRTLLRELVAAGHLLRRRLQDATGRWRWETRVYEEPLAPPAATPPLVAPPVAVSDCAQSAVAAAMPAPPRDATAPVGAPPAVLSPPTAPVGVAAGGPAPTSALPPDPAAMPPPPAPAPPTAAPPAPSARRPPAPTEHDAAPGPAPAQTAPPREELPYSPYIAGIALDYSRELGDPWHGPSNVSQALRLWQRSGLGESAFVEQLHEARRRLRLYQGKQGPAAIANKAAYFFRILEELVRPPAPLAAAP